MSFKWSTLGELSIGGGKYGISAPAVEFDRNLPAYLRITDINDDGSLNLSGRKSVADPLAFDYMLQEGDIVFARTGSSTGRNYYYDLRDGDFAFAGFLIKFSLDKEKVNPRFIKYYVQSKPYWDWVSSFNTGSTRGNINAKTYAQMPVPLPDRDVQDAIVCLCDSLSNKIRINNRLNDNLAELCELIVSRSEATDGALSDICTQVTDKVSCAEAQIDSYVSTESLLADKNGRQLAASVPQTGKVVVYKAGDTLVSNIRPYFKKIWFAENDGTCSGDVVVFRANNPSLAPYLYAILRSDKFFDYVMSGAKGTKMPRGDKKQMMSYGINPYCPERDLEIIAFAVYGIGASNQENQYLSSLRDSLLPKLMSGEIDTSKVEPPTLPNNHLSAG